MEDLFIGADRAGMVVTYRDGMICLEPVCEKLTRDIRPELMALIDKRDTITFDDLFHYFDFGICVPPEQILDMADKIKARQ